MQKSDYEAQSVHYKSTIAAVATTAPHGDTPRHRLEFLSPIQGLSLQHILTELLAYLQKPKR